MLNNIIEIFCTNSGKNIRRHINSSQNIELKTTSQKILFNLGEKRKQIYHFWAKRKRSFLGERGSACFDDAFYYTVSKTGLHILRSWLCYSPELHKFYCHLCWRFGENSIKH